MTNPTRANQLLAQFLSTPQPSSSGQTSPASFIPAWLSSAMDGNKKDGSTNSSFLPPHLAAHVGNAPKLENAVPPAPQQGPAPNFVPPLQPGMGENSVNQNPPSLASAVPPPPAPPPPVTSASMGGAQPPMGAAPQSPAPAGPVNVPPMPDPTQIGAAPGMSNPQEQGMLQRLLARLAARDPQLPAQMAQGQVI